jgi:transposase
MNEDILVMRQSELKRLELVKRAIAKELTQAEVAQFLELSLRQVQRVVRRVRDSGNRGVMHGKRGKANCRRISEQSRTKVLSLFLSKYKDFGATLASEKLAKCDGITVSRETLRKWLRQEGCAAVRRRKRKHRLWRARKEFYGQMVQMDGSHHDWLEGRGPWLVLMGYIDDASNRAFGKFYDYEGTIPAMGSFKGYAKKYGIPQSVYLDCHSTYKSTVREQFKARVEGVGTGLSEFERAMKELGVNVIHAHSPQAKGRIERLFRTLQDRLVKELRLSEAKTIEQANEVLDKYLVDHNRRYLVEPQRAANVHRKPPKDEELDGILCIKKPHVLRNDSTVVHKGKLYQILEWTSAGTIEVRELIDGRMLMMGRGRSLKFKPIDKPPVRKRVRLSQKISRPRLKRRTSNWGSYKTRRSILSDAFQRNTTL